MSHSASIPDTAARPTDWLGTAPCKADPDAMFPGTNSHDIEHAKSVCRRCPVIDRCLQWALDTGEEHGVWGGLSEAERRKMRRNAARPISLDDYAGTRTTRQKPTTLPDAWEANTQPAGDHLLWTGARVVHQPRPATQIQPNRLSFFLDRGRWPEGPVKRMCGVDGCVKPSHLTDVPERSGCGTRNGYQRHLAAGELVDDACRQANTDADNRLRRTGTTKAAA